MGKELNVRQKAFVDNYLKTGNATAAAIAAGYAEKSAGSNADKLLKFPHVIEYMKQRAQVIDDQRIADIIEAKQFWTTVMRGELPALEIKDRLKASEYLAKTYGAFIDKIEHSGELETEVVINIGGAIYGQED